MTQVNLERTLLTVATVGILTAVVSAIIYFMRLPIFTVNGLSWFFVFALVSGATGLGAFIIKAVWENAP